jgi:hypothetical protein
MQDSANLMVERNSSESQGTSDKGIDCAACYCEGGNVKRDRLNLQSYSKGSH